MPSRRSRKIRGVLLDLDGTVYEDGELIAGAADVPTALRAAGLPFRFVTNTTRRPRSHVVRALREMGLDIEPEEILTAPVAAAAWLRRRRARRIYPLLSETTFEDLRGFELTESEPEFVVVGDLGEAWDYARLNHAFQALMEGAELVAVQRNRYWRRDGELVLDAGPFVTALEYASGKAAHVVGKPSPEFFATAVAALGLEAPEVAMVGDDLAGDVEGARQAGLVGVAVRTGKYRPEDEDRAGEVADAVLDSLADLPKWLEIGVV
jgi:phospholysine phosphohistidine inorganic pyrophosphate phosphatase